MPGKQWPGKIERLCFINNRKQAVGVGMDPSLNGLGILNSVKRPAIDFTASRICDVCRDVPSEKLKQLADMLLFLIISQEESQRPFGQAGHIRFRKTIFRFIPMRLQESFDGTD